MSLPHSIVQARLWVALGLGLAAPVALAQQMSRCETECASEPTQKLQVCLEQCPGGRTGGKSEHFQACALRCKEKFDTVYKACSKQCPGYQEPKKAKDPDSKGKGTGKGTGKSTGKSNTKPFKRGSDPHGAG